MHAAKKLVQCLFILIWIWVSISFICAADEPFSPQVETAQSSAELLVRLKVMSGYPDGSLQLERNITRAEFFTLCARMTGYDKSTDLTGFTTAFKDLDSQHWAYNPLSCLAKRKIIGGYADGTIRPGSNITLAETLSVMIRILGYQNSMEGSWPLNVTSMASQLGLDQNLPLPAQKTMTRGETAILIFNALSIDLQW